MTRPVPTVMGILNVTPDSFSDGGRYLDTARAVEHGRALVAAGADVVDVGGESTRPGAARVEVAEELARVVPVVRSLAEDGAVVSIDTMRAEVAAAAVEAGARVVNDVSGGLADPAMLGVVADAGVTYVAMHWRAHSTEMADFATYDGPGGVVAAVVEELGARAEAALAAGVAPERLVLDPGIGFAKRPHHNWELLAAVEHLRTVLGRPLLVGASRKMFLGALLADDAGPRPVERREPAHTALVALLAERGVWGVRVHDVAATRDALAVVAALGGNRV